MLFSEEYCITRRNSDDWLDTIIDTDTRLFIDPFLIFRDEAHTWDGAHDQLIAHFDRCFKLIAEGGCSPTSVQYRKALALLTFPEPREFCLGYTTLGTRGSGGGKELARLMARAMARPRHGELSSVSRAILDAVDGEGFGVVAQVAAGVGDIGASRVSDRVDR
jgi:hypothetical protein